MKVIVEVSQIGGLYWDLSVYDSTDLSKPRCIGSRSFSWEREHINEIIEALEKLFNDEKPIEFETEQEFIIRLINRAINKDRFDKLIFEMEIQGL